jgi:hypothetical protein
VLEEALAGGLVEGGGVANLMVEVTRKGYGVNEVGVVNITANLDRLRLCRRR